jgi:hypothetical protein
VLTATIRDAFADGFHAALLVAAAVALIGVVVVIVWLPARAPRISLYDSAPPPDPTLDATAIPIGANGEADDATTIASEPVV